MPAVVPFFAKKFAACLGYEYHLKQSSQAMFVMISRRGAVAQSVEHPSKGPGSRCNSTDMGSNHENGSDHAAA